MQCYNYLLLCFKQVLLDLNKTFVIRNANVPVVEIHLL